MSAIGSLSVRITPDATGFQRSVNSTMTGLSSGMGKRMAVAGTLASATFARTFRRGIMTPANVAAGKSLSSGISKGLAAGMGSIKGNVLQMIATPLARGMKTLGYKASLGLTLPLAATGAMAVKTAADFESSMSQLSAALDKPMDQMGKMEDLADQVGKSTVYSAKDAADAMVMLAKSGFSEAEIQAGALTSTMDLAAAGGMDLASSATLVSTSLKTFGLEADQAGRVADSLSGAASSSSAEVLDLSDALAMAGQAASMNGQSIETTAGVLAAFADNGLKGSDAGTSLKTMLMRLSAPTAKAQQTMDALGMSFYDAQGNMKSLEGVAGQLRTNMSDLTQKQRAAALTTMFGADAIRAANILYREGAKGLRKYIDAASTQGNAQERAAKQLGPMATALESLSGSLETARKELGQALAPIVMRVADLLGALIDKFTDLPDGVKTAVAVVGVALASLGPLLVGLGIAIQGVVGVVSAIGFIQMISWAKKSLPGIVKATQDWAAAQKGVATYTAATEAAQMGMFGTGAKGKKMGDAAEDAAKMNKQAGLLNVVASVLGARFKFLGKWTDGLATKFPRLLGFLSKTKGATGGLTGNLTSATTAVARFGRAIPGIGWVVAGIATALLALKGGWDAAWEKVSWFAGSMTGIWNDIVSNVTGAVDQIKTSLSGAFGGLGEALSGMRDTAEAAGMLDILAQAFRALGQVVKGAVAVIVGFYQIVGNTIVGMVTALAVGMQRASALISSAFLQIAKGAQVALSVLGNVPGMGWAKEAAANMDPLIANLEAMHAYNNVPINVRIESKKALTDMNALATQIKTKVPKEVRTKAGIDLAGLRAGLPSAVKQLNNLPKKYQIKLGIESKQAKRDLALQAQAFQRLPKSVKTKLIADAKAAKGDVKGVKDDLDGVKDKKVKVDATVKNKADVKSLKSQIDSLDGKKIKITADATSVKKESDKAQKDVDSVEQGSPIKIEADNSQALTAISQVKTALAGLQSIQRTITYSYETSGEKPAGASSAPSPGAPGAVAMSAGGATAGTLASSSSGGATSGIMGGGFRKRIKQVQWEIEQIRQATQKALAKASDTTNLTEQQIAQRRLAFQRTQRQQEEKQQRRFDDAQAARDQARSRAQAEADKKKLKGQARSRYVKAATVPEQALADTERKRLRALQDRAEVETAIYDEQQTAQQQARDQIWQTQDLRDTLAQVDARGLADMQTDLQRQLARGQIAVGAAAEVRRTIAEIGIKMAQRQAIESKWESIDLGKAFTDAMKSDADSMEDAITQIQRSLDFGEIASGLIGQAQQQVAALQQRLAQRRADEARWASEDLAQSVEDAFKPDATAATINDKIKELTRQLDRGELPDAVRQQAIDTIAALRNLIPTGVVSEVYDRLTSAFEPLTDFGDIASPGRLARTLRKNTTLLQNYSANMARLKASGASAGLIEKIQGMDPVAAGKLMQRLLAGGAGAISDLDSALAGLKAASEGATTALSGGPALKATTVGSLMSVGGPIGVSPVQIDVYPSAGMDEQQLAAATSKELAWQLSAR